MGSDQEISSDIVFEILTRTTSLKTLDACKTVCKGWNQMIYESSFMPSYCQRTKNLYGYFIQDMKKLKFKSKFVSLDQSEEGGSSNVCIIKSLPRDMRILASCNQGILCCVRRRYQNYRYYVCKPATQQWQALPNPKLRYRTDAIAIMVLRSSPLRYKIVRLSGQGFLQSNKEYYSYRCEIFDSHLWTWRTIQEVNLPYTEFISDSRSSIFARNSVYWLTTEDNVLAFHEAEESFHQFPLPEPVHKNNSYKCKQLVEYGGRLGFTCLTEDEGKMELWLTDKNPRNDHRIEWRKKTVVNYESLERVVRYPSPAGFYNGEIAFFKAFWEVVFYKLQDCSFRIVELDYDLRFPSEIFQFRSDLEPVSLRRSRADCFGGWCIGIAILLLVACFIFSKQ